ncbi:DNA mismatch repair protein MutS [Salinirubellus salinus]|uniref:DNA mismatch repair protein MutS n=1 Tax=Salinirubellus salinus TaxID=1364945 RepID=A0A9E7R1I2_9EURY|nr:DNA mismatch repair protein MutS [Salinirubellus salinus]UWM53788.1 DNA mismatch repair protein MutS [Salinirubellus salinus]
MADGIVGEFFDLKQGAEADLLAMQMGDFYEFFGDDAETVGAELDLKVSKRSSGGENYSMAGVPVDDLTPYLKALVERGYRVAVADQFEDGGDIERRVARVVTPGTLVDPTDTDARYLATVVREGDRVGLAFLDVTTGQFRATAVTGPDARERALTELYRFAPTELLPGPELRNDDAFLTRARERVDTTLTLHDAEAFAPGRARHTLREQFGAAAESVGLDDASGADAVATRAAGAALAYVDETGVGVLASVTRIGTYDPDEQVTLDATTQRNLELVETMTGAGQSLLDTVDHTETAAGGRLLKEWLTRPLQRRGELARRQSGVAALAADAMARERLHELLSGASDLERLASRSVSGSADAGALLRVRDTLALLPELDAALDTERLRESPAAGVLESVDREAAADLRETLAEALAEDPPNTVTQGGLLCRGFDDELDELVERHESALEWVETLAEREKRETGLSRLSVDRNKTDGYYVQVGKSQADDVPERYEAIKTLKNSERFVTPELREKEREILRLEEARGELEYELFRELRERVAERADLLQSVGRAVAELDTLASLATHAVRNDWTRPELTDSDDLDVTAGRHPVVEQDVEFVPNDLRMCTDTDDERRFLVVTGPNMSGKSTYMRQSALIVLLAQVGSFVPADRATVGLVDGIYTRVGALDELAQGRSTFMVEMQELSNILHSATEDSLVILDEVGRGTATYDGISIAWAATEYLSSAQSNVASPKVLFATHYHELTGLAEHIDGVENVHVAAEERDGDVTFLRSVVDGATDRSYGIHVAELAGVPDPVVSRAREVLRRLREDEAIDVLGSEREGGETQQVVFDLGTGQFSGGGRRDAPPDGRAATADGGKDDALDPATESVLDELRGTDVNETPPVELLAKVQEWQSRLEEE